MTSSLTNSFNFRNVQKIKDVKINKISLSPGGESDPIRDKWPVQQY